MKLFLILPIAILLIYNLFSLIQVFIQLRANVIYPITKKERVNTRKRPDKPLRSPTIKEQKNGLFIFSLYCLFLIVIFIFAIIYGVSSLSFYPFLLISLFYMSDILNLFAIGENGILIGGRFIHWKKIQYFQFKKVDVNNKYYGYAQEVNDQYELIFKLKFLSVSCFILADEMKEHVRQTLLHNIPEKHEQIEEALK